MRTIGTNARSVEDIKAEIIDNVGNEIHISTFNKQGKQTQEFYGKIREIYDRLFVMAVYVKGSPRYNRSISYNELSTKEFSYEFIEDEKEIEKII